MDKPFDLVIKNARVVRPRRTAVDCLDIAVKDGRIARLAPEIAADPELSRALRDALDALCRVIRQRPATGAA